MRHLPLFLLGIAIATPCLADETVENWQAKGQATYVSQKSKSFSAAYSGPNSLSTDGESSYTFTSTAYLGARLWQGSELYLNVEAGQGDPLSRLTGLGGFTNGEATRVSGTSIKAYRQRLFLRQTWALGDDTEFVESAFNQMAGHVAKDRFVLTMGNFSTLDIFDGNAYAKDPRTQFMNWSNMAHAAFDYAADARGFGWGFAGEWYQGDWVFRFGRMTGPREPNALPIDYQIKRHYGDQIELEHAHEIADQPGKIRLLAFRNRANLAAYRDGSTWLDNNPGPDQIAIQNVRNGEKIKYGFGLNIEQAITENIGAFLRAMRADGRTETYAFTEADASFATGLSLKGSLWGRSDDTVGVAWMRNALSHERRDYLAKGGISFFIGDGALNYRPENILETYYSLKALPGLWLTADYQRISNPAYNADRGPANILSLRAHAEF
uniref:OmpA-like transmembrane domain n=1 Tax=Dechloromonas aromatica (strain RCB) TaxID=159087 RepID=Q47A57_DECAR